MSVNFAHLEIKAPHMSVHLAGLAEHAKKAAKALIRAMTWEPEAIFKSRQWPYY